MSYQICEQLLPARTYKSDEELEILEMPIPPKNQEWLNTEEAAAYLRLSVGSLRNLTSNGVVPHYKLGSRNRYLQEDLRSLLLHGKERG